MSAIQLEPGFAVRRGLPLCILGFALQTMLAVENSLPAFEQLPSRVQWPDPLSMLDGKPVSSREEWTTHRRPELQRLFQHYMYGAIPPRPPQVMATLIGEYPGFLSGKATLKLVVLTTGPSNAPRIDLMLVIPNHRRTRAPVFLAMNFCGNHAVTDDRHVPLTKGWLGKSCQGCTNNRATELARGRRARRDNDKEAT